MPLTLVIFLTFDSKNYLYMNIEIFILISTVGKTVLEGPKMNKMGTLDHGLKCWEGSLMLKAIGTSPTFTHPITFGRGTCSAKASLGGNMQTSQLVFVLLVTSCPLPHTPHSSFSYPMTCMFPRRTPQEIQIPAPAKSHTVMLAKGISLVS